MCRAYERHYDDEIDDISIKMAKLIDSSDIGSKVIVERFLCLGNKRLNELFGTENASRLVGIGEGLKSRYEAKFGRFCIRDRAILNPFL